MNEIEQATENFKQEVEEVVKETISEDKNLNPESIEKQQQEEREKAKDKDVTENSR